MPTQMDVLRALWGAARLARFDASGATFMGGDNRAAVQSFFAAVLIAPMYLVWNLLDGLSTPPDTPPVVAFVFEILQYVCGWLVFPVLFWHLAQRLDCRSRYAHFIAAYNWTAVYQNAIYLLLKLSASAIGLAASLHKTAIVVVTAYVLAYSWFVAKTTLRVAPGVAAFVVFADFATTIVWSGFVHVLAYGE